MGHVDDPHDAEGDGKTDGGEKIQRGKRKGIERKIGEPVETDDAVDRIERCDSSIGNRAVGLGIGLVEGVLGKQSFALGKRHEGRRPARLDQFAVGIVALLGGIEGGKHDAFNHAIDSVGNQRLVSCRIRNALWCEARIHQHLIGRVCAQITADTDGAGKVVALGNFFCHFHHRCQQRVERGADIDGGIAAKPADRLDALLRRGAETNGQQAFEPLLARTDGRIGLIADCSAQRFKLRGVGVAFDRHQCFQPLGRIGVGKLKAHKRGREYRAHTGIGPYLRQIALCRRSRLLTGVDVDQRQIFRLLLHIIEQAAFAMMPDLLVTPAHQKIGDAGQFCGKQGFDNSVHRSPGRLGDVAGMLLKQCLKRCILGLGMRGCKGEKDGQ